jgi:hypothetical protein
VVVEGMTAEYTATISRPDEDGWVVIRVMDPTGTVTDEFGTYHDQAHQWVAQELAILNDPRRNELCVHDMSAALCTGPNHF